ncbi:pseudaminic acid synthase [Shewanella sp. JM162201]|uniref:Pseudaminic acid synthase n=1 Tax=Shewanella jiangmenensis TaxID=2837387 RepID=A0ABS5V3C2_9GAMM|nr:pseudaminic acid synthase [Shewanella jiangmenensis]MBT1444944.1 pseudaminic acid synthase [Shewanella jiangmenensis]
MTFPFSKHFSIAGRGVGEGELPLVIAELSGNHKGSLDKALALVDAAAAAGADAIKIQTYTADTITLNHNGPEFCINGGLWAGKTLYELYQEAYTPWEWHQALFERAANHGIPLFSSPFDGSAVDLLESLSAPAYKIASFEINDIALIERVSRTGKPLIISTGLATLNEIEEAVRTVRAAGGNQLALLHCISGYPTPIEDCNLHTLMDLARRFDVIVGLSDHTKDSIASVTAVALGAQIIEKHFTLDRNDGSVDAAFSLEPDEFAAMVKDIRRAHAALGRVNYDLKPSEAGGREFRRSLYVCADIKKGDFFNASNVRSVRPGLGLHTRYLPQVLGQQAACDIAFGTALSPAHLSVALKEQH